MPANYKRREQERKGTWNYKNNHITGNTMAMSTKLSIITLNVSGINTLIKRQIMPEWEKRQDTSTCCLQETHFRPKDTCRLKVRAWRNIYPANGCEGKARVAILVVDKTDFKTILSQDIERHCINHKKNNPTRR